MILLENENIVMGFIALLVILFVVILILAMFSEAVQSILEVYLGRPLFVHFMLFPKKLDPQCESILNKHFTTYNKMRGPKKLVFASRVARFMTDKVFVIDKAINDKQLVKVLISATAVKLTFGLRNYLYPSFHTIAVRPSSYYSRYTKTNNKGETNAAGFIIISWKDFLFGYSDEKDSLNLGYHEFAHALFVEHLKMTMESVFSNNFKRWQRYVKSHSKLQEVKNHQFFRDYATHNIHEFFAVSVENFFENPGQFRKDLPQLYKLMARMLNQYPN